ncbi:MAG TPA: NADH-quinone oxidoreductase subunit A [Pyrinomonadaceae bacterium]|nr:NADH-quinone oxidoreductase subunit A [Pyrinomonadaceae bacterium]
MSEFSFFDYVPLGIMFLVAAGFGVSQLLVTQLIGPRKRTSVKLSPYECGKDPVGTARERFSIKFYTVAVIFLLFDIEVLFIVPFAVAFKSLLREPAIFGVVALVEILVFIATLIAGYIYVWKKGVFEWGVQSRVEAREEAKRMARERRETAKSAPVKIAA